MTYASTESSRLMVGVDMALLIHACSLPGTALTAWAPKPRIRLSGTLHSSKIMGEFYSVNCSFYCLYPTRFYELYQDRLVLKFEKGVEGKDSMGEKHVCACVCGERGSEAVRMCVH